MDQQYNQSITYYNLSKLPCHVHNHLHQAWLVHLLLAMASQSWCTISYLLLDRLGSSISMLLVSDWPDRDLCSLFRLAQLGVGVFLAVRHLGGRHNVVSVENGLVDERFGVWEQLGQDPQTSDSG